MLYRKNLEKNIQLSFVIHIRNMKEIHEEIEKERNKKHLELSTLLTTQKFTMLSKIKSTENSQ